MRINGNFFNFMNSSFFNRSSMVSRLFGSRTVGSQNVTNRNIANRNTAPNFMDGVIYSKGNRTKPKLYTRHGTWVGARPKQNPNRRNAFRPLREDLKKVHFDIERGILEPKQMSVKDNEVRFDDNSYYQFTGKDGKTHTVLSASGLLSADVFSKEGRFDEEAAEYADFWMRLAHTVGPHAKYSQDEIRNKLEEAGIQHGFFTVAVGNHSHTYFFSQNEDAIAVRSKEAYDKQYNALVSGEAFESDDFQPGQTVSVGGKEYVLNENKGIDIAYGAEIY